MATMTTIVCSVGRNGWHRFLVILTVWLFSLQEAHPAHVPRFLPQSPDTRYSLGRAATLKCSVTNLGGRTVIWRKLSDPFPISIGKDKFSPNSRYRIQHDDGSNDWFLTIKKLERADGGDYECRVTGAGNYAITLSLIIPGDDNTHFLSTPADINATIGDTVLLPCRVNHLKKFKVAWLNPEGEVISLRKKIINGDQRLKIVHSVREEWSLQIRKVYDEDFGRYTCLVNSDPVISRSVLLKNSGPAVSPPFLYLPISKKSVKEGESVELECQFQGFPDPKVSWYRRVRRNGRRVKESLGKLKKIVFDRVGPEDAGDYYCTGKNGIRPLSRGKIRLFVEALPTTTSPPTTPLQLHPDAPRVFAVEARVGQRKGRDVELVCRASGDPKPIVYWKRHGSRLYTNFKHRFTETDHDYQTVELALRIRSVLSENYGDYECVGVNQHGTQVTIVHLYEIFE